MEFGKWLGGGGINSLMLYSLYVHIPFCKHRCHYCDFITFAGYEASQTAYVNALIEELRIASQYLEEDCLHSVYFGGGTPSLLSVSHYSQIINAIYNYFSINANNEISLEANPGSLTYDYLCGLRELGFNRLSLGVQSTDSFDLIRLDRSHSISDVLYALRYARKAEFENINLDLIFNLPWQDKLDWEHVLSQAIALRPEHFSLYSLIIEEGTPLHNWYQRGWIERQDQDIEAEMFETAIRTLDDEGYVHYEISNWAKRDAMQDFRCVHNLQYWLNLPYLGVGVGAHGYMGDVRTENVKRIEDYLSRFGNYDDLRFMSPETPATLNSSKVDVETQMKDFMWLGLRLVSEGVSLERFYRTFRVQMTEIFKEEIEELLGLGLIHWTGDREHHLTLTERGLMLANQVFMRFV